MFAMIGSHANIVHSMVVVVLLTSLLLWVTPATASSLLTVVPSLTIFNNAALVAFCHYVTLHVM
jgi:hypothetical protein